MNKRGTELAKVLWYYNLVYNTQQLKQKIICPFHADENPSLLVNLAEGTWHCFGCGLSGDAQKFTILMEKKYHGLNDLQALKRYHQILQSKKVSNIKISKQAIQALPTNSELYAEAYDYYHGLRLVHWEHDDNIDEVAEAKAYLISRGFTTQALDMVKCKVTYQWAYSIIFPIMDNGKFKGWVSRTMDKNIEQKRKYLYNTGFSRATTCCGKYGNMDYVFVVEGYMDMLKMMQFGLQFGLDITNNIVALLGWKMSNEQEQKLKAAGVKYIISALDNDVCGRRGTEYLKTIAGFDVTRWCYLRGIKDPGEMDSSQFIKMYHKTMQKFNSERK